MKDKKVIKINYGNKNLFDNIINHLVIKSLLKLIKKEIFPSAKDKI